MVDFLYKLFLYVVPMFFAIVLHEMSHGLVALFLGDDTAKRMDRFKLHTHFDPFGSFILPIILYICHSPFLIGYAKPVPVDVRKFKDPKLDFALVAIAGPLCNFALALLTLLALTNIQFTSQMVVDMLFIFAMTNLGLGFFNLIPIPPLDGSRIVSYLLPEKLSESYVRLEYMGIFLIFGLEFLSDALFKAIGIGGSMFYYCIQMPVMGIVQMFFGG